MPIIQHNETKVSGLQYKVLGHFIWFGSITLLQVNDSFAVKESHTYFKLCSVDLSLELCFEFLKI